MTVDPNIQGYLYLDDTTTIAQIDAMLLDANQHSGVIDVSFGNFDPNGNFIPPQTQAGVMAELEKDASARGIKLKISLGGANGPINIPAPGSANYQSFMATAGATLGSFAKENGFSGVDLDIEGLTNPTPALDVQQQVDLIHALREGLGSSASITYTVEGTLPASLNYQQIIQESLKNGDLTAVNLMAYDTYWSGYDFKTDIATLQSWGLSNNQIILGAFPYSPSGGGNSIEQIQEMAQYAKDNGIAMSFWDINNDYDGASGYSQDAGELAIWNEFHP